MRDWRKETYKKAWMNNYSSASQRVYSNTNGKDLNQSFQTRAIPGRRLEPARCHGGTTPPDANPLYVDPAHASILPESIVGDGGELIDHSQSPAGANRHTGDRVVGDNHIDADFGGQHPIQSI